MELLLSIVVPVYNVESFLEECIHSIERIKTPKEVICIDDGSTDHSLLKLRQLAEQYNDIVVIEQENSGVSKARNHGISIAKGKFICFFDSDDMVIAETIDRAVHLLVDENLDCVAFDYQNVNENCRYQDCKIRQNAMFSYDLTNLYSGSTVWKMVMKKEIIDAQDLRFIDLRYGEDSCFRMHFNAYCTKAATTSMVGYLYRKRSTSVMHNKDRDMTWFNNSIKEALYMDWLQTISSDGTYKSHCRRKKQLATLNAMTIGIMVPEYSAEWVIDELKKNGLFPFTPFWKLLKPNGSSTILNYLRFGFFSKTYYKLFFKIIRKIRHIK